MYHSDPATPVGARRKALTASIAALLVESGFGGAEESALETLVEMAQSCKFIISMHRLGIAFTSSRCEIFCEIHC